MKTNYVNDKYRTAKLRILSTYARVRAFLFINSRFLPSCWLLHYNLVYILQSLLYIKEAEQCA